MDRIEIIVQICDNLNRYHCTASRRSHSYNVVCPNQYLIFICITTFSSLFRQI